MTRSFFSEEKKEPKKSLSPSAFLTKGLLGSDFFRGIIFRGGTFTSFRRWCCFRASGVYLFLGRSAHLAAIIFCVSRFREWRLLAEQLFTRAMFTAAAAQSILGGTCSRSTIY